MFAIQNRNNIDKAFIQHHGNIVNILHFLTTITNNIIILLELSHIMQCLHQIQIEGRRSLQMHIIFQHFGQHEFKMGAFCTVAIMIIALIIGFRNSHIEPSSGLLDILGYLRQIRDFQRCSILLDNIHQGHTIEYQFVIFNFKLLLRKFVSLRNQINVLCSHFLFLFLTIEATKVQNKLIGLHKIMQSD